MSYLPDNLPTVEGGDETRRRLRVLHARGSALDTRVREVEAGAAGPSVP